MFGAGCGTRMYRLLITAFLSTFHSQPKLMAVVGFYKVVRPWDAEKFPECQRHGTGRAREGVSRSRKRGSGISTEKIVGLERL